MGRWRRLASAMAGLFTAESNGRGPADDFWYEPIGLGTHAGVRVTPDIALKASALFSCVKVLAETIGSLPLHMYRQLDNGGRELARNHPLEDVIADRPNAINTAVEFWEFMVLWAAMKGTSYAEIVPGLRGAVDQLKPLHPDTVREEFLPSGRLRFEVRNPSDGTTRRLVQEEVFRLPGLSKDGRTGISIVDYAANAIGLGMAADEYAARVFSNNLNFGAVLIHPGKLSEEAQTSLVKALMRRLAGPANSHRPLVLQENMKVERIAPTAKDSQMEAARKWQILEIARYFRMPPHMLGISDGATHSNVEEQSINFVKYTLRPWVVRIEQAIKRDLIIGRDYSAKFTLEGLLRGNAQARADYLSKALGAGGSPGWISINEARVIEGFNPIEGEEYDRPPTGNNPSTEPTAAALPPPRRALPAAADPADALIRKEIAALRKAAMRHAGDVKAWRDYARSFFGGQVSDVMARLGVDKEIAARYCKARSAQCCASEPALVIEHIEVHGHDELARIVQA